MHTIRLRRYRQHLVPLTDMDASDDSDEDDQIIDDEEPVFMVRTLHVLFLCIQKIVLSDLSLIQNLLSTLNVKHLCYKCNM